MPRPCRSARSQLLDPPQVSIDLRRAQASSGRLGEDPAEVRTEQLGRALRLLLASYAVTLLEPPVGELGEALGQRGRPGAGPPGAGTAPAPGTRAGRPGRPGAPTPRRRSPRAAHRLLGAEGVAEQVAHRGDQGDDEEDPHRVGLEVEQDEDQPGQHGEQHHAHDARQPWRHRRPDAAGASRQAPGPVGQAQVDGDQRLERLVPGGLVELVVREPRLAVEQGEPVRRVLVRLDRGEQPQRELARRLPRLAARGPPPRPAPRTGASTARSRCAGDPSASSARCRSGVLGQRAGQPGRGRRSRRTRSPPGSASPRRSRAASRRRRSPRCAR